MPLGQPMDDTRNMTERDLLISLRASHIEMARRISEIDKKIDDQLNACEDVDHRIIAVETRCQIHESTLKAVGELQEYQTIHRDIPVRLGKMEEKVAVIDQSVQKYENRAWGSVQTIGLIVTLFTLVLVVIDRLNSAGILHFGRL